MRYLFYLESYAFLWSSKDQILVYNSLSGHKVVFQNNLVLTDLINKISLENLSYSLEMSSVELKKKEIQQFIRKIRGIYAGDIIKIDEFKVKPAIIIPYLNFQKDKSKLNLGDFEYLGDRIIENIYEINICTCELSSKSPLLKKSSNTDRIPKNKDISVERITNFIKNIPPVLTTNINIFLYNEEKTTYSLELLKKLPTGFQIHIIVLSSLFPNLNRTLKSDFSLLHSISIQLNLNEKREFIEHIINRIAEYKDKLKWVLPFSSIEEYELAWDLINNYGFENYDLLPIYNSNNIKLFEELIYIDSSDIENIKQNRRQIFANQTINSNDFGRLTITDDGYIYANIYYEPLGTIYDNIRDLIYKEMDHGKSWRRIRDMDPCCNCVYQWLCPSPSNYELALGKPNLCHIVN